MKTIPGLLVSRRRLLWKRARIALEVFGAGLVVFLLFLSYGALPNRWYRTLYVYSGSMAPAILPGDLILITPPPAELSPGMVITLKVGDYFVTHRLVRQDPNGIIITKGDANIMVDDWSLTPVTVVGVYRARIPYLGYIVSGLHNLIRISSTGAWFVDREQIPFQINFTQPAPLQGTSIKANLTAEGFVETARGAGNPGQTKVFIYGVKGEICAVNTGAVPTRNLRILAQVESKENDTYFPYSEAFQLIEPDSQLEPGERRCFSYRIVFEPSSIRLLRVVAQVTITNHSGWLPGSHNCPGSAECLFGPNPKVTFRLPAVPGKIPGEPTPGTMTPTPILSPTLTSTLTPVGASTLTVTPTLPEESHPTASPSTTPTPTPSNASLASPTFVPTDTPTPTATPTQQISSPTPLPCYQAEIKDARGQLLNISLSSGNVFNKVLTFVNTGSCGWWTEVQLEAREDNLYGLLPIIPIEPDFIILPGEEVKITLLVRAPLATGEYHIHYRLVAVQGNVSMPFKILNGFEDELLIILRVTRPQPTPTIVMTPGSRIILPTTTPAAGSSKENPLPTTTPDS